MMGVSVRGFSQTTVPADFFAGKWGITRPGTPNGDAKRVTDLARKDGKLTGELKDPMGTNPVTPLTKIGEDVGKKLTIHLNPAQAGETAMALARVEGNHLKEQLISLFDSTALRLKNKQRQEGI